jgi:threonine dehydrogenase-like Zn-dependent dehydrogenase
VRALRFNAPFDVTVEEFFEPSLIDSRDAIVRVAATCVCGSDLWYFRGDNPRDAGSVIGHECIGEVVDVGSDVRNIQVGDFVVVPFLASCGECRLCLEGQLQSCIVAAEAGVFSTQGAQAEYVRTPFADGSLVVVPGGRPAEAVLPHLLAISDVMATGYHAAMAARVQPGYTVAVVGDGAVGLSGVLAARMMGAERIIALSRHADRQAIAASFGATDIVAARGEEAVEGVRELTAGIGADAVLECVGTEESMTTAIGSARAGATVGFVGLPHGAGAPLGRMFRHNIGLVGGVAPSRLYTPALIDAVLAGEITPGDVCDRRMTLEELPNGYVDMNERRAIKVWATP